MSRRIPAILLLLVAACGGKVVTTIQSSCGDQASCVAPVETGDTFTTPVGSASTSSTKGGPTSICTQSHITIDCPTEEGYTVSSSKGTTKSAAEQHVIEMYEARSDHSVGFHPRGSVSVHISRQGHHELVLGSYEPVDFVIEAEPGAFIDRVTLGGYNHHTAKTPAGTEVIDQSGSGGSSCYEATSCQSILSSGYTDFAGCYRITKIDIGDEPAPCSYPAMPWSRYDFTYDRAESGCAGGARWVHYDTAYKKWVGAELCSPSRYKLFLGETQDGVFHELGDTAGDGQDHCELVNPNFTIPNEDEITSGTCKTCASQMGDWESPGPVPVYTRANFGQPFELISWPENNVYTSLWYECGVSIGN